MSIPQRVLEEWARHCEDGCGLGCGDRPCGGCCAGGLCDASECSCDDEREDDADNHRGEEGYEP